MHALQFSDDHAITKYLLEKFEAAPGNAILIALITTTTSNIFVHYLPILKTLLGLNPEMTKMMVLKTNQNGHGCLQVLMATKSQNHITDEEVYILFYALYERNCKLLELFLSYISVERLSVMLSEKDSGLTVKQLAQQRLKRFTGNEKLCSDYEEISTLLSAVSVSLETNDWPGLKLTKL